MFCLDPPTSAIIMFLFCLGMGFASIFTPWLVDISSEDNETIKRWIYLYRTEYSYKGENGSFKTTEYNRHIDDRVCTEKTQAECTVSVLMNGAGSASIAFIVLTIAASIGFIVVNYVPTASFVKNLVLSFYFACAFLGILIFPTAAMTSIEGSPYHLSWHSGFWIWLVGSLTVTWSCISYLHSIARKSSQRIV